MKAPVRKYTEDELENLPVSDAEFEAFMRAGDADIALETVEFFVPEFAE